MKTKTPTFDETLFPGWTIALLKLGLISRAAQFWGAARNEEFFA